MKYYQVERIQYILALVSARDSNRLIRENTTHPSELAVNAQYWLSADSKSGFGIMSGYELIGVFSTVKGRGSDLVRFAITVGAEQLDCYEGHLVDWYTRFGFVQYAVENNYDGPNAPKVVFMELSR